MDQDFDLKYKFALFIFFLVIAVFGVHFSMYPTEYTVILERYVKLICPSCQGLG